MSSFDGHLHEKDARIILKVLAPVCVFIAATTVVWKDAWLIGLGIFIGLCYGFAITPDADHVAMTREEYRAMKRWGLFGALLVAYMTPYAYLVPHRSKWSHTIFPGTFIRMAYVLMIPTFLLIMSMIWLKIDTFPYWLYAGIVAGWCVQDMFHYIRDDIGPLGTSRKKRIRW